MGDVEPSSHGVQPAPFNGTVEIGLRALCVLTANYPAHHSLQRLTVLDYLVVHSDDLPDGPAGLHPKTPYRGGEILARRGVLQEGLLLYQSRGLVDRQFTGNGVYFVATDHSAGFLDSLGTTYVSDLRDRATWVLEQLDGLDDETLRAFVNERIGAWGAEFTMQSVLWMEGEA